ncbi:hypothetical protein ACQP2F_19690 [Actinoplanes sp. CA-030573]|uniref:hypothetical protein n=1 Tax=Actinoplanes sp. CA-030573 TaxID=3239898 RepID=UPI003D8DC089
MATCNLCPPGSRDVLDTEMEEHLSTVHPEVEPDGTDRSDDSSIVRDSSLAPGPAAEPGASEWHGPAGQART